MSTPHSYIPGFNKRKMKDNATIKKVYNLYVKHQRLSIKEATIIFNKENPNNTWSLQSHITTLWELGYLDRDDKNTWICPITNRESSVYYVPQEENHPIIALLRENRRATDAERNAKVRVAESETYIKELIKVCESLGLESVQRLEKSAEKFEEEVRIEMSMKKDVRDQT